MSQYAVPSACHRPVKFGLASGIRGICGVALAGVWAFAQSAPKNIKITTARIFEPPLEANTITAAERRLRSALGADVLESPSRRNIDNRRVNSLEQLLEFLIRLQNARITFRLECVRDAIM